ncbi:MAG: hypothetical protein HFH14_03805 [Lachnospiraceae bacterium]|nr:hypothetical protein [Lachnospiraceae bacterium]
MKEKLSDKGSITVFLCLMSGVMLILIVSLLSVMRLRWEKTQIVRSANIATQAEFGKFYRPLYDSYRMFYYIETNKELLEAGINSYFIKNQRNMPKLLALTLSDTYITDRKYATDNGAENVRKQITEAVKHAIGEKVFDEAVGQFVNEKEAEKSNDEVLKGAKKEIGDIREDAELETKVLELLKTVEGVSISGGNIRCPVSFVKEGIAGEVTSDNAGVGSDIIWKKTKDKYTDISLLPRELKKLAKKGGSGNSVSLPAAKIKSWREKLSEIRRMTVCARDISKEINQSLGGGYDGKLICNTVIFEKNLDENIRILDSAIAFADLPVPGDREEWGDYMHRADDILTFFDTYHVRDLRFDYSTLSLGGQADPRKGIRRMSGGILKLLLDDEKSVSKKAVSECDIYYGLLDEDECGKTDAKSSEEYMFDDDTEKLEQFVGECRDAGFKKSDGKITDIVAMSMYINMFFGCFLSDEAAGVPDKALDYEMEYIIAGKTGDEMNLKKVAEKILMLRTGISMVHILSDPEKRNKAYIAAAAIVGFTGMDALVRIVQYSIIAAWAYEDACVDVGVLLAGKKIPYIKKDASLNVSFSEIPLFGKEFIKKKIAALGCDSGMDYGDYIKMLLLSGKTKLKTCRIMDIIQYNIKQNNSMRFSFQDALYGATVNINCVEPYESGATVSYSYK